jgi:hypothetical protein
MGHQGGIAHHLGGTNDEDHWPLGGRKIDFAPLNLVNDHVNLRPVEGVRAAGGSWLRVIAPAFV